MGLKNKPRRFSLERALRFLQTGPRKPLPAPRAHPFDPCIVGSGRFLVGGPGSGKSRLGVRLALHAGLHGGVPTVIQDTSGDITEYVESMMGDLTGIELSYLESKVLILDNPTGQEFLDYCNELSEQVRHDRRHTVVFLIDEAGTLNYYYEVEGIDHKVDFWTTAKRFRNMGATYYVMGQKDTDVSRDGRNTIGAIVFMRPYEARFDFFGTTFDTTKFPDPITTGKVAWISAVDKMVREWDMASWKNHPRELVGLVNITKPEKGMGFK